MATKLVMSLINEGYNGNPLFLEVESDEDGSSSAVEMQAQSSQQLPIVPRSKE